MSRSKQAEFIYMFIQFANNKLLSNSISIWLLIVLIFVCVCVCVTRFLGKFAWWDSSKAWWLDALFKDKHCSTVSTWIASKQTFQTKNKRWIYLKLLRLVTLWKITFKIKQYFKSPLNLLTKYLINCSNTFFSCYINLIKLKLFVVINLVYFYN